MNRWMNVWSICILLALALLAMTSCSADREGSTNPTSPAPEGRSATLAHDESHRAPLEVEVISPEDHARAGAGGTFSVDLTISARSAGANDLLAAYQPGFIDPSSPAFHPGPDAFAPGLVVLLSTTPTIAGTPLQGPNTNLAGVFQINDTAFRHGRKSTFNSWLVGVPGFFGRGGTEATLTVFVVNGTAPAVVDGSEKPISNVETERFTIAN